MPIMSRSVPYDAAWDETWQAADGIPGWLKEGQARLLWDEASVLSPGATVLEIGSHQGRSTVVLGNAVRRSGGTVIAVDPFVEGRLFGGLSTHDKFRDHLHDADLEEVVELVQDYSTRIIDEWTRPVDLLYIDGKHDYWTLSNDLRFSRHLPPGGVMLIHDSFSSIGVTLGLLRHVLFSREITYERRSDSQALFRKRRPSLRDRWRILAEMPWWIRNVFVKVLLRLRLRGVARVLGPAEPAAPGTDGDGRRAARADQPEAHAVRTGRDRPEARRSHLVPRDQAQVRDQHRRPQSRPQQAGQDGAHATSVRHREVRLRLGACQQLSEVRLARDAAHAQPGVRRVAIRVRRGQTRPPGHPEGDHRLGEPGGSRVPRTQGLQPGPCEGPGPPPQQRQLGVEQVVAVPVADRGVEPLRRPEHDLAGPAQRAGEEPGLRPGPPDTAGAGAEVEAQHAAGQTDEPQSVDGTVMGRHQDAPTRIVQRDPDQGSAVLERRVGEPVQGGGLQGLDRRRTTEQRMCLEHGQHSPRHGLPCDRLGQVETEHDAPGHVGVAVQPHHASRLAHRRVDISRPCRGRLEAGVHAGHHKVSSVKAEGLKKTRQARGMVIAVAMGVMNITTYGFTILAARLLGPRDYGAFAALMGVLLVIMVVSLALQATAARRIAATPGHVHQIESVILRVGLQASLGVFVVCLALSPVIDRVVRLDSLGTAALTAFAAAPLTMMGAQAGILQGERRWRSLAMIYVGAGVPRLLIGTAMIVWRPTEFSALLGVAVAAYVPVLVGWIALRHPREPGEDSEDHSVRALWSETFHNSNTLFAFFALSNVDILVARNVLDEHQAGLYAGGLILVKAVLFLPQFVVVLAFPSMSDASAARATLFRSLGIVVLLGLMAAGGAAVLSGLAVVFVGGDQYSSIQHELWLFGLLGTALSLLQLLIYSVLARQARRAVLLVWAALFAVVVVGQLADSINGLMLLVLGVDVVLLVALLAVALLHTRRAELATSPAGDGSVRRSVPAAPGPD
jgi:O-antigen/teichoic acid export membrane protein